MFPILIRWQERFLHLTHLFPRQVSLFSCQKWESSSGSVLNTLPVTCANQITTNGPTLSPKNSFQSLSIFSIGLNARQILKTEKEKAKSILPRRKFQFLLKAQKVNFGKTTSKGFLLRKSQMGEKRFKKDLIKANLLTTKKKVTLRCQTILTQARKSWAW